MSGYTEFVAVVLLVFIIITWFMGAAVWGIMIWLTLFGGEFKLNPNNPFKILRRRRKQ